jgi:hypothetical protein
MDAASIQALRSSLLLVKPAVSAAKHEIVNSTQTVLSSVEMLELELTPAARTEVISRLSKGVEHLEHQVQQLVEHVGRLQAQVEDAIGSEKPQNPV